ncbi:MAG: histidine phosphatase family protein [Acidobacteriota bacterium]
MSFVLVRHGETDGNRDRIVQVPETPLNSKGLAQATSVAERLRNDLEGSPVRIVASDLARAAMTAEPIARALGLEIEWMPLLQERNFGDLRGQRYDDIGLDIMAPGYEPPAGESWEAFDARVTEAWSALCTLFTRGETIIAVSHGLVCRSLARHHFTLEGLEAPDRWGNTAVSVVSRHEPYEAVLLNCTRHLEDDLADGGHLSGL